MKRITAYVLSLLLCVSLLPVYHAAAAAKITILVNNKSILSTPAPVLERGVVMAPVTIMSKVNNCSLINIAAKKTYNLKTDTTIVSVMIGSVNMQVLKNNNAKKGKLVKLSKAPKVINKVMYIPLKEVAEALGATVGWDNKSNTLIMVFDTTLKYNSEKSVYAYAGTGEREHHDSTLDKMSFVSPESVDVAEDGSIYIADAGVVRKIKDGKSETVKFEPEYITADIIRCYQNDVFILTNEFEAEDGTKYFGIIKLTDGVADGLYSTEANYSLIYDFDINVDGKIYMLENNVGVGKSYLSILDVEERDIIKRIEIADGFKAMTDDGKGHLYLANATNGTIWIFNTKQSAGADNPKLFAGVKESTKFVDGPNAKFFEPTRLKYADNSLYVLDYNIVRKIAINSSNLPISTETLAGRINFDQNPVTNSGKGSAVNFAHSYKMDLVVIGSEVLLTDPKKSVLRIIK